MQIEGLREIIAAGGQAQKNLVTALDMMREMQSIEGTTLLDSKDVFAAHTYSFGGIDDVIMQFAQQLAGAIGVPMSRLFGQSPKGLNATGEGDMRVYHENIAAAQESQLRGGLNKVVAVEYRSLFGRDVPDDLDFDFRPLVGMSDQDKSTLAGTTANVVIAAYDSGVIDQPTALRELQAVGGITGIFTNITDEAVQEAEDEPPPAPGGFVPLASIAPGAPAMPGAQPAAEPEAPSAEGEKETEGTEEAEKEQTDDAAPSWRRWLRRRG
mgnify:CR=1 FL=1